MTDNVAGPPNMDLYTRNGFAGPATMMVRTQYTPSFSRVEGEYTPRRLDAGQPMPEAADPRALPVTILASPTVRMDVWQRVHDTPFAIRDVHHDQIFYVLDGTARLETDFGVLDLVPMDVIRVPRAVSLRLVDVHALNLVVVATPNALHIHPENDAVLSPADVDGGRPYENPVGLPGEYELMIRHGASTTSYFYDYDPLPVLAAPGAPVVQRFNLANVHPLSVKGIAAPPARLIEDPTTETLFFYLGAREGGRPPVHHNADYDEIAVFAKGPGQLGEIKQPGTVVWVPKGVIHQGPEEYVPEGYVAWLFETRAHLELTPAGQNIATLAETSMFGVHPSVTHLAPVG